MRERVHEEGGAVEHGHEGHSVKKGTGRSRSDITADGRRESGRVPAERRSIRRTAGARQESRADDRIGVDHGRRRAGYGREAEYTADGR